MKLLPDRARKTALKFLLKGLSPPDTGRWVTVFDSVSGAWGADYTADQTTVLRYSAVFACIRLIANDIGKLPFQLIQAAGERPTVWQPSENVAYSPVIRKPNHYQTRIEFFSFWLISLLLAGNTYVLKGRDQAAKVRRLIVLDPNGVYPLVADDGSVFYRLSTYKLAGLNQKEVVVPASEIIHHKYLALNHPLIGCSPLQVAGAAATAGQKITKYTQNFFTNSARPAGVLEAPEGISTEQGEKIRTAWESFSQEENQGKVAVLENGLKFTKLSINSVDAQMLETLQYTREDVCTAFGVPAWKIGAAPLPAASGAEADNERYYQQTLQPLVESIELLVDEGLSLPANIGVEFDLRALLRMSPTARVKFWKEGVTGGIFAPDEARADFGYLPAEGGGGNTPYLQQQNYSLAALAKRDAKEDPFAGSSGTDTGSTDTPPTDTPPADNQDPLPEDLQQQVDDGEITEEEARQQAEARASVPYRGVYKDSEVYVRGEFTTHQGSMWHCKHMTQGVRPGTQEGAPYWTLAVKRGS